ncbi:MAG: TraB/GumN family protein [Proteobacteria bacterium]|nr:TraB/GumN family protein [Pseudomonadota bacterium]
MTSIVASRPRAVLTWCGLAVALLWLATTGALAQDGRFDKGLLWRLEPPGGGQASYLLGTMHVADPRVLDVAPAVRAALAASDTAVFEVIEGSEEQLAAAGLMFYQDGRTLDAVLGPELWQATMAVARDYGLTSPLVRRYKPWGLLLLLSLPVEQMRLLLENGTMLDTLLQDEARQAGKNLIGLETAVEQVAVFDEAPEEDQIALLASLVESKAESDRAFDLMLAYYLERDLAGLVSVDDMLEDSADAEVLARFMDRLKTQRDRLMFERLQPLLDGRGLFIAVGALHLTGPEGLLERFAGAGYTVTAVH